MILNETNNTNITDLYASYNGKEAALFKSRVLFYVMGTVIILCNVLVVFSSGLLLKKGQQPRSTYMLLGNLSLADTILGLSILLGISYTGIMLASSPWCPLFIGLILTPGTVSGLTVGLIAVDRYVYIVHGLHYQRWVSTKSVRIAIIITWAVGIAISFMPVIGWTNQEFRFSICSYMTLFPKELAILHSTISILPVIVVICLYSVILYKAIKNVDKINSTSMSSAETVVDKTKLKTFNRNNVPKLEMISENANRRTTRSASVPNIVSHKATDRSTETDTKSVDNLSNRDEQYIGQIKRTATSSDSVYSIHTIASSTNESSNQDVATSSKENKRKTGTPAKFRAVCVVLLTTTSFLVSVIPFSIALVMYETCENKLLNPRCLQIRALIARPLSYFVFINSMVNPLIYAWWHKGFQRSVKYYFTKFFRIHFSSE